MISHNDVDDADPMLLVNKEGIVEHANMAALRLFGGCIGRSCVRTVRPKSGDGVVVCKGNCPAGVRHGSFVCDEVSTHGQVAELSCVGLGDQVLVSLQRPVPAPENLQRLTPREREVLGLVANGMNTTAIAVELGISRSTVRTHVERCRVKLGAASQAEAVVRAYQSHQLSLS